MSEGRPGYGYFDLINCTILPKRDGDTIPECYFPQEFKGMISKFNVASKMKSKVWWLDFNQWEHGMAQFMFPLVKNHAFLEKSWLLRHEHHTWVRAPGGVAIIQ